MRQFYEQFRITSSIKILDVGGSEFNWLLLRDVPNLTILNLQMPKDRERNVAWIIADARCLPFKAKAFDVVYSNSVIEHLGKFDDQKIFASECRRAGIQYCIQTPNKRFPIEPHLITPFIHYLPKSIQRLLLRNFTLWGLITRPSQYACDTFLDEVCLLNERELQRLFPDAKIWHERVLGFSKSITAVKNEI
jgi:hypothetical protein